MTVRLSSKPDDPATYLQVVHSLRDRGDLKQALQILGMGLKCFPTHLQYKLETAEVLLELGHGEQARRMYDLVLREYPGNSSARSGLALIHERKGELREALEALGDDAEAIAGHTDALVVYGRVLRKLGRAEESIKPLRLALEENRSKEERCALSYVLGENLDTLDDCDGAFAAFHAANAMRDLPYDLKAYKELIEGIKAAPGVRRGQGRDDGRPRLVFIVGMPRSGSSLIEQVLASHPRVHACGERGELGFLAQALPSNMGRQAEAWTDCLGDLDGALLKQMRAFYLENLGASGTKSDVITDKMPDNLLYLGLAERLFPGGRVIFTQRHPMATGLSCFMQNFGRRQTFSLRLDWIGSRITDAQKLVSHWKSNMSLPFLDVSYEEMVLKPEETIRGILDFCGLPFHRECLQPHLHKRSVATASYDQVRKPIYRRSLERWQHYHSWLLPLENALGSSF